MTTKINLNKELDYEMYADIYNLSFAGVNFGQEIKDDHPNINTENYKKYIDDFYNLNRKELLEKQAEINKILSEKQDKFQSELKNIFNLDFTAYTYKGYLSIFNCNPRWPESKTFQIYYKKDLTHMLEVALHESLHFAFFEYLDKNFSEQTRNLSQNNGVLWEMSEIFNVIILNLSRFREILEIEEKLFYPKLKSKLIEAQKIWDSCKNVNEFVTKYLNEAK